MKLNLIIQLINILYLNRNNKLSIYHQGSKGQIAREQLINAGVELFGEYGLHGATTRDISRLANQNIASIAYYFSSKEGLYLAVAQWIADFIQNALSEILGEMEVFLAQEEKTADDHLRLIRKMVLTYSYHLCHPDTMRISKVISREQLSPTEAYPVIHQQSLGPMYRIMAKLIGGYIGLDPKSNSVNIHTHAIMGEILAFRINKETICSVLNWQEIGEDELASINLVLIEHIELLLNGLRAKYHG